MLNWCEWCRWTEERLYAVDFSTKSLSLCESCCKKSGKKAYRGFWKGWGKL